MRRFDELPEAEKERLRRIRLGYQAENVLAGMRRFEERWQGPVPECYQQTADWLAEIILASGQAQPESWPPSTPADGGPS